MEQIVSNKKLKIGWQKYEDLLEKQLASPLLNLLTSKLTETEEEEEEVYEEKYMDSEEEDSMTNVSLFPVSPQLLEDMAMLSNYECWVGHTNFDITEEMKEILNSIDGIEVMKVCSRYRFFIGIGQMFSFKNVRGDIEKALI
tara:strand:- start:1081 stop:1506 length:426 start_codon:yes stop_codon:yes gene_type:complete